LNVHSEIHKLEIKLAKILTQQATLELKKNKIKDDLITLRAMI